MAKRKGPLFREAAKNSACIQGVTKKNSGRGTKKKFLFYLSGFRGKGEFPLVPLVTPLDTLSSSPFPQLAHLCFYDTFPGMRTTVSRRKSFIGSKQQHTANFHEHQSTAKTTATEYGGDVGLDEWWQHRRMRQCNSRGKCGEKCGGGK